MSKNLLIDIKFDRSTRACILKIGYKPSLLTSGGSWHGPTAYAKWLGERLPTENEWEFALKWGLIVQSIYGTAVHTKRRIIFQRKRSAS
ncbi:MAG: SUMF1/EgtB/PvdO family nonheme iron enzyme [Candidatus Poribacteria bacterium]